MGLNPAIDPQVQRFEPPVIARLRSGLEPGERALGIGQELPPNVLMRFGLADPRNYDSVELARSLRWFAPLFEPGTETFSSRSQITWQSVDRARDRLEDSCVKAVVGTSPPPTDRFAKVERSGEVWIAWLNPPGWVTSLAGATPVAIEREPGRAVLRHARGRRRSGRGTRNVGPRLDCLARRQSYCHQYIQKQVHVSFGSGWRPSPGARVSPIRGDLRTRRVGSGNRRCDTRLDRTCRFLDSWNNQERAWTDPCPKVRIEPVNLTGHMGPAHQI